MPYQKLKMSARVEAVPEEAAKEILLAYREAGMHQGNAARALGCSASTLLGWVEKLGLGPKVEALREEAQRAGWHHKMNSRGGRPRKRRRAA